jgi:hypothetical protein
LLEKSPLKIGISFHGLCGTGAFAPLAEGREQASGRRFKGSSYGRMSMSEIMSQEALNRVARMLG